MDAHTAALSGVLHASLDHLCALAFAIVGAFLRVLRAGLVRIEVEENILRVEFEFSRDRFWEILWPRSPKHRDGADHRRQSHRRSSSTHDRAYPEGTAVIYTLSFANGVAVPKKIVDTGRKVARVKLQVLDGSTIFLNKNRDLLLQTSNNVIQGLQIISTDRIVSDWVVGELWALGNIDGAALAVVIEYMPEGSSVEQIRRAEGGDCETCGESLEL